MKLSRKFLILASAALAAAVPSARADVTVKYLPITNPDVTLTGPSITVTNLGGPGLLAQPTAIQQGLKTVTSLTTSAGTTLTINQLIDATTATKLLSASNTAAIDAGNFANLPTIVKTGGATLQYDAFRDFNYLANNTFKLAPPAIPVMPNDLRAQLAFSGILQVAQGTLQVSGYVNQWANYGVANPVGYTARMEGAAATLVQGSSTLSFQGTAYNVVGVPPQMGNNQLSDPSTPLVFRLNYVHNLYSGTLSNFLAGNDGTDTNTVLDVGKDAEYIVDVHIDDGVVGSIGRIDGAGRLYKSGLGTFTVLNSSRLTGDVFVLGGGLVLSDPNNQALRLASSVNLIGGGTPDTTPGSGVSLTSAVSAPDSGGTTEWRPGYLPQNQAPQLSVTTNQTIRNFQSLWNETATNMYIAGTGAGTSVDIAAGTSLTVIQDAGHDGYYTGSINGGHGRLVKEGLGGLALMGQSSTVGEIDINAGRLIANVQSLGYGRIVIGNGGTLSIVQNDASTLRAQINGAVGSVLTFSPLDSITSTVSSNWPGNLPPNVGNGQLGVADVYNQQQDFYGQVVVKSGITLAFSYGKDDTFIHASSIVLDSGVSSTSAGRETTIRFNDTTQTVNNLSGDANTRIELGRGSITLNQTGNTAYAGKITGAGNLIKTGGSAMTLAGLTSYYGATVIRGGTLVSTATDGIINSSGLVLANGTYFTASANQTVGALFGQAGSTIGIAAGATLTVGKTDAQVTQLNNALTNFPGVTPDANPAFFLQTDLGVSQVAGMSQANTIGFLRTALGEYTAISAAAGYGNSLFVKSTFGLAVNQTVTGAGITGSATISAIVAAPTAQAAQTATGTVVPLASTTGFLLNMPVSGAGIPAGAYVTAIGANSITLNVPTTVTATGVITGTSSVTLAGTIGVLSTGSYTLAPVTTNAEVLAFRGTIVGAGGLTKVGDQTLTLKGVSSYTGATNVNGGTLQVDYNTLTGTSGINVGILGNLSVNVDAGTQAFTRTVTGEGSFTKVGAGTLTVDTYSGWVSGAVNITAGALQVTNSHNLGTLTGGQVNVALGGAFILNTNVALTWSGSLAGAGDVGINTTPGNTGTLTLAGPINLTGDLTLGGGKLYANNLPADYATNTYGTVALADGTTYRDTVASTTGAQTVLGTVVPVTGGTAGFSVGQTVSGAGIPAGTKIVALTGGTLTLSNATTALVRPTAFDSGTILVQETFGDNVTGDLVSATANTTFEKAGLGNLTLGSQLSFIGDVVVKAGTLTIGIDGALDNARSISLEANTKLSAPKIAGVPATLDLNNLTGDVTSVIDADHAALTFGAAAGATLTYAGQIIGSPTITFNGADVTATLSLIRAGTVAEPANVIGAIDVQSGTLIGTIAGFGGATLNVSAGAKIGFNNSDAATPVTYAGAVTGTGTILKTGVGQVTLSNGGTTASAYEVQAGKLTVFDTRAGWQNLIDATIASNATLEVTLGGNLNRMLGAQIQGTSSSSQGILAIVNATASTTHLNSNVWLTAAPALSAITIGDNISLVQGGQASLVGVNGSAGSMLFLDASATVNQAVNTQFNGTVVDNNVGVAKTLTFVGAGRASFTNQNLSAQLGTDVALTVGTAGSVGNLEIDSRYSNNTTAITLVNGSLAVNTVLGTPAAPTTFNTGLIDGTTAPGAVKFIKTGAGSLNANTGVTSNTVFSSYEVQEGTLVVTPVGNQVLGGRSVALRGGNLAIQQDANNATLGTGGFTTGSSSGTINIIGSGTGSTGSLNITGSFSGGLDLQGNGANVVLGTTGTSAIAISGLVNVGANSTLGGQVVIGTTGTNANLVNAGTVSPGYSPGIITVNGNVNNSGEFVMELSAVQANGTYNDQVRFTGTADLNNGGTGSITLKQYGAAAPAFGRRHVLFKDTLTPDANSFTTTIPVTQVTAQGANPFRYLLSYSNDVVTGQAGELAVYVVRAPSDYDAFKASTSLLTAVKAITQVDSVKLNNGVDGLAGTSDDVYRSTPAGTFNNVGYGLAILGDAQLQTALDNLTPYGASGSVTAAGALFRQSADNIARRLELRRFDRSGLTILSNEWYVDTIGGQTTVGDKGELKNKATTYGVTAGYSTQVRLDGVAGFALTAEHFSLSSDVDTHASGNGFEASAYVGTVAAHGQLSLDAGASLSFLSSSVTRASVVGAGNSNTGSAHALTLGAWARLGTVLSTKSSDTYFTPFIGVEAATTKLSDLSESGQADAMKVTSSSVASSALRVGFGVHHMWEEGRGDWRYRLSADFGYAKQLSGEFGDFTSSNTTGIDTTYTSHLRVNAGSGFYVKPSLNFGPDENSTYTIGFSYEKGKGNAVGVNAGFRKRF